MTTAEFKGHIVDHAHILYNIRILQSIHWARAPVYYTKYLS